MHSFDDVNVLFHDYRVVLQPVMMFKTKKFETVQLGEFRELNTAMVGYVEDLTADCRLRRKFKKLKNY